MGSVKEDVVVHASQYYDPVKAHEYYLKTRELKGRQARARGEGLNSRQKEGFDYSKSKIAEAQATELEKVTADIKAQIEAFKNEAAAKVEEFNARVEEVLYALGDEVSLAINDINTKQKEDITKVDDDLKTELSTIAKNKQEELAKIQADISKQIAAVPKVPKSVDKETAIRLAAERSAELAKIRGDGAKAKQDVVDEYTQDADYAKEQAKTAKQGIREKASEERYAVSNEAATQKSLVEDYSNSEKAKVIAQVKDFVSTAQQNYEKLTQDLKAKYDEQVQSEYNAIKETVR